MRKAKRYRLQAVEYSKQSLLASPRERDMFRLLVRSWLDLAELEDERARLDEARSFEPRA